MGLLSPFPTAWVLLLMPRLHYIHNANQAASTGNRMALQFHLLEMQGSFGSVEANPEGRLGLRLLATTAATHGHFDLVRHLCKEWDVPANAVPPGEEALGFLLRHTLAGVRKGEGLDTPLVQAIQNGQEDMALYLLSLPNQALDLGRQMTSHNYTVLHNAAKQGLVRVIKELVEQHGMDFVAPDGRGMTPLCLASESEHSDTAIYILKLYLKYGRRKVAMPCSNVNLDGPIPTKTLRHIIRKASFDENTKIALSSILVREWGAAPWSISEGDDGICAFEIAAIQRHYRLMDCFLVQFYPPDCTLFIKGNPDLSAMTASAKGTYSLRGSAVGVLNELGYYIVLGLSAVKKTISPVITSMKDLLEARAIFKKLLRLFVFLWSLCAHALLFCLAMFMTLIVVCALCGRRGEQQPKKEEVQQVERQYPQETKKVRGQIFNNAEEFLLHHAPSEFVCPITHELLCTDPVIALDTFVYERKGIEGWFGMCRQARRALTSPKTQEVIGDTLISNSTYKTLVNDFIQQKMKEWAAIPVYEEGGLEAPGN